MALAKAKSNASGGKHRARWATRAEVKPAANKHRRRDDRRATQEG